MTDRLRSPVALGVTVVAVLGLVLGGQAGAQTPPPATTPTTTNFLEDLVRQLLPTTTVAPAPTTTAAPVPVAVATPTPGKPAATTTTTLAPGVIPKEYIPL
ncbi:MAG TPA: hypothetical protein VJ653_03760, partial [Acidimicrobiales bacterium]|nr:hypothetical protein [Acidimicrobiales bacterium]